MNKPNQNTKNRFDSLPDNEKLEILGRYVDKYKGHSLEILIDMAISHDVAGQLASNSNYQF